MKTDSKGKKRTCYLSDYVVFDLETTGINVQRDRIIEISAIKVSGHRQAGEYSTLVNPGRSIPPSATAVNGITDAMVASAPGIKEAMEGFLEFIGDEVLVGHNIHGFDMRFVYDAALAELGREVPNDYVDTLYLARKCLPQLAHHRLTDVSEFFGIATEGAHRALNDCIMNMKCYEELGRLYEETIARQKETAAEKSADNELICPQCGEALVRRKGKFGEFYGCSGFPICRFTKKA